MGIMPVLRLSAVIAALTCLLAACAPLRWEKTGLDAASLEADLEACRTDAWLTAGRYHWFPPWPTYIGRDRAGRPIFAQPFWNQSDRFFLEQDLFHSCMRHRGYELVPDEK
jgi:hypothetical protein